MTFLELVNRVLRRLREDEVDNFTAEYSQLVADFVAEAHAEVLEAHDWSIFDEEIVVPLTAGTAEYDVAGTSQEAQLRYVDNGPLVAWFESDSATQGQPIRQVSWQEYTRLKQIDTSQAASQPTFFALRLDGEQWEVAVWPTPDTTGPELRMTFWNPEARLDSDTDATSRTIMVPWRPVFLGALYLSLNERGEEIGEPGNMAETRYYLALGAAKEADALNSGRTNRYEFYRD